MVYWTIGAPLHETTITNRCDETQTYEARLAAEGRPRRRGNVHHARRSSPSLAGDEAGTVGQWAS
jgi:hypothetical protein